MFNLKDTGSISSLKLIFMYFIFPFLFCKLILSCQTRTLHSALFFSFHVVLEFSCFLTGFLFVLFVAQSLASGTVEEWATADIKLSLFLLHFWERKQLQWEKNFRFEINKKIKTDLGRVDDLYIYTFMAEKICFHFYSTSRKLPENRSLCLFSFFFFF